LEDKVTELSTDFGRLVGEVSALRSALTSLTVTPAVSQSITSTPSQKQAVVSSSAPSRPSPQPPVPSFDSRIISGVPEIFAEFRKNQISLLWRGSRDGFGAQEFHRRCDGHANTLTVILDTKGNTFGGFTPVEWESRVWNRKSGKDDNCWKADDSQKSFVFTLKNPHNIPARRFALKAEMKHQAIYCNSHAGPVFGSGYDIIVRENCNANTDSFTSLGWSYTNDAGLRGGIVFAGSDNFRVTEIEVFEITA
jgi:hypothetical protein